jgi:hypothetical protein
LIINSLKNIRIHIIKSIILALLTGFSWVLAAQNAWINEFHYDNTGDDTNEMIEIVIENAGNYNLSDFVVTLYNGNGSITYGTAYNLSQYITGSVSGSFSFFYNIYPFNGIQNGGTNGIQADGIALSYQNVVIPGQFISYEGTPITAINGIAAGMTSIDIGVEEDNPVPASGNSLQLSGTGSQYSAFTWQGPAVATAGLLNNGQIIVSTGASNPVFFNAATVTTSQVDLSWDLNSNSDSVIVAFSLSRAFGNPSGSYPLGGTISGGGTIIYKGTGLMFSHTGLNPATEYFYKAWSRTIAGVYSAGVSDSASTQSLEPSGQPVGLLAACNGFDYINVSWNDSDGDHYLVKGSSSGYSNIAPPVDGSAQGDSLLVKNVNAAVQTHQFTSLVPNTTYYFKIYPYSGTGNASMYKTDGAVPQAFATTGLPDIDLFISEVADPRDSSLAKFVEIYNSGTGTINFSNTPVYLCRQSNGGTRSSVRLTGSVSSGGTHVIGYVLSPVDTLRFFKAYGFIPDQYSGYVSGNGNDGYFLYFGGPHTTGYLFDSYGVMNQDGIGEPWEYTDKKAVRKRNISNPNATWTASEWVILSDTAKVKDMTPNYHKGNVNWLGTASTSWNTKGTNWGSPNGYIPDASCIVTIPNAGNYPIITEPSAVHQVEIQTGSTLSIQSTGSLQIVGP